MSRPVRLLVVPLVLLLTVSGTAFALAKLHPAKPGKPAATGDVVLGDSYAGQVVFEQNCAGCHGDGGEGGGIGPRLKGNPIGLAAAKARIEAGGGAMPPGLVRGKQLQDVLAYLATILAKAG